MSLISAVRDVASGFKSLLVGMRITAREASKPIITVQYPRETLAMPARFRGHIKLVLDPATGKPLCTACMLCGRACPSGCIELDGLRREGDKKKSVSRYDLDFTMCSLCGSCVEVCPSDAIEFSKDYNVVSFNRDDFGHMDLYKKVQAEAEQWAKTHPAPPASANPAAPAPAAAAPAPTTAVAAVSTAAAVPAAMAPAAAPAPKVAESTTP